MRPLSQSKLIQEAKQSSLLKRVMYTNDKNEVFIYEMGQLVEYADTKVIDFETDKLVNLAQDPYID